MVTYSVVPDPFTDMHLAHHRHREDFINSPDKAVMKDIRSLNWMGDGMRLVWGQVKRKNALGKLAG
jgi:hypothetical protein